MKQRRFLLASASLGLAGFVSSAACGSDPFGGDENVAEAGMTERGETDGPAGDALPPIGANEDVDPDGGSSDAMTIPDGGGRLEAGIDAASCCDCDGDGFKTDGGTCAKPSGDCDDLHPYLKPGQAFIASPVWDTPHTPVFDWDCNGAVSKQFNYGISCDTLVAGGCDKQGFTTDVACGASGTYVFCKSAGLGLNCAVDRMETRTQGCR